MRLKKCCQNRVPEKNNNTQFNRLFLIFSSSQNKAKSNHFSISFLAAPAICVDSFAFLSFWVFCWRASDIASYAARSTPLHRSTRSAACDVPRYAASVTEGATRRSAHEGRRVNERKVVVIWIFLNFFEFFFWIFFWNFLKQMKLLLLILFAAFCQSYGQTQNSKLISLEPCSGSFSDCLLTARFSVNFYPWNTSPQVFIFNLTQHAKPSSPYFYMVFFGVILFASFLWQRFFPEQTPPQKTVLLTLEDDSRKTYFSHFFVSFTSVRMFRYSAQCTCESQEKSCGISQLGTDHCKVSQKKPFHLLWTFLPSPFPQGIEYCNPNWSVFSFTPTIANMSFSLSSVSVQFRVVIDSGLLENYIWIWIWVFILYSWTHGIMSSKWLFLLFVSKHSLICNRELWLWWFGMSRRVSCSVGCRAACNWCSTRNYCFSLGLQVEFNCTSFIHSFYHSIFLSFFLSSFFLLSSSFHQKMETLRFINYLHS